MKGNRVIFIGLLSIVFLQGCSSNSINEYKDYLSWLNDKDNGLVFDKEINGIQIKVKHLPSNFLAYQDLINEKNVSKSKADSLIQSYDKSLTFLLTLGIDGEKRKGDIMYQGVQDYEDYKRKLYHLNFDIENRISLKMEGKEYKPVLSNLENVYGLTDSRKIMLVFVPHEKKEETFYASNQIQFTYDDDLFNTGINHFTFNRKDINNTPTFTFWN